MLIGIFSDDLSPRVAPIVYKVEQSSKTAKHWRNCFGSHYSCFSQSMVAVPNEQIQTSRLFQFLAHEHQPNMSPTTPKAMLHTRLQLPLFLFIPSWPIPQTLLHMLIITLQRTNPRPTLRTPYPAPISTPLAETPYRLPHILIYPRSPRLIVSWRRLC